MDLLVTTDWLAENLVRDDVKVLDGTWVLPSDEPNLSQGFIPNAQIFDIDKIADLSSDMTHMRPTAEIFAKVISAMGIESSDHVICYDRHGLFSSPRVWWTFMSFGHDKVSVLDGGLPAWVKAGNEVRPSPGISKTSSAFETSSPILGVSQKSCVLNSRSGHIPGSISLPFGDLKTAEGHFKPLSELTDIVGKSGIDLSKPIITSCGSGITAAGLSFIFHGLGAKDISVYDGSWTE